MSNKIKPRHSNSVRKLDWIKIRKQLKTVLLIFSIFILLIFCVSYFVVYKQNGIREKIATNSSLTTASVVSFDKGHRADYEFFINGNRKTGSTFKLFKGEKGDQICVRYSIENPNINLYCEEEEMESIFNDVVIYTLKISGIFLLFYFLIMSWMVITKNKDLLIETTSKKKNNL